MTLSAVGRGTSTFEQAVGYENSVLVRCWTDDDGLGF